MNKKGFVLSTYVYMLLVFFLLLLSTMLAVLNNSRLLTNKLKEQSSNTSGLIDKDYSFILLGDKNTELELGEEYEEAGFIAKTTNGVDISDSVKVIGNVDSNNVNEYTLTYKITYNGVSKELKRFVNVVDKTASVYIRNLYINEAKKNGLIEDTSPDKNIRYAGANPNNYVYFNCKDKDSNNVDYGEEDYDYKNSCEIWRIIGVFDTKTSESDTVGEKRVKIVREAFSIDMSWDSSTYNSGYGINEWSKSDVKEMLNGYYIGVEGATCRYCNNVNQGTCESNCSSSVTPLSETALSLIEKALWNLGASTYSVTLSLSTMYSGEKGIQSSKSCTSGNSCTDSVERTTTWEGKIGLIYPSDYAYASTNTECSNDVYGSDSTCKLNNWLHPVSVNYWTISPYSSSTTAYGAGYIGLETCVDGYYVSNAYGIRPSLYLSSNVKIIGGDGKYTPYKINISKPKLTIDLDGGTTTQKLNKEYSAGTQIELIEPTKDGYDFIGWKIVSGDSKINGNLYTQGKLNTKIKAEWKIKYGKANEYITTLLANENTLKNGLFTDDTADKNIRYAGANPNNYVYFNCKDKDSNDVDYGEEDYDYENSCEIWRIIGVFDVDNGNGKVEKRIKLVRDPFSLEMNWDSSASSVNSGMGINQWGESGSYEGADLMQMLNGYYIGKEGVTCTYCNGQNQGTCTKDCSGNITPLSEISLSMIGNAKWYLGTPSFLTTIPISTMYDGERSTLTGKSCSSGAYCNDKVERTTGWLGKIGLIYPSDYGYASSNENCTNNIIDTNSTCSTNNWLQPTNGDYWTISPRESLSNNIAIYIWSVYPSRNIYFTDSYYNKAVRPSLYLSSNVKIIGGDGKYTPYKLAI